MFGRPSENSTAIEPMHHEHASLRSPLSTYRLQLHAGFGFKDATAIADYLAQLGVHFVYTSPLLRARPGSNHGYDVVDPTLLNPEIGSHSEFETFSSRLSELDLSLLVDIVPNHMGVHETNPWWTDVLAHGNDSKFARYFDVDWDAAGGKIYLPVLGDELDAVLERGELKVEFEGERAYVRYFETRFPARGIQNQNADAFTSVAAMRSVLDEQVYVLRRWNGDQPLNYRRFFSVSELIGLCVEHPDVFEHSHRLILDLVEDGKIAGLRIDHPDGLFDPLGYFHTLQAACADRTGAAESARSQPGFYVVIEKILTGNEAIREDWPVHGGTGYEHMNTLAGVFVDRASGAVLRGHYERFTRSTRRFIEVVRESKRCVLEGSLEPELVAMSNRLQELFAQQPDGDRFEPAAIREVLREVMACFPVYRTYVRPSDTEVQGEDRAIIEQAFATARSLAPELSEAILAAFRSVLLLEPPLVRDTETLEVCRKVLLKFQQMTGPAAAKGVEDTAFYRYVPLLSLNEVGGEPDEFGVNVLDFHTRNAERARRSPLALTATSTHDTKRSEDVRCRISALSEQPHAWGAALDRWQELNAWAKQAAAGISAPDANDEYMLYQTLVGAWPFAGKSEVARPEFRERIRAYMLKAIREAKRITRWIDPNADYERVVGEFVDSVLDETRSAAFLDDIESFQVPIARCGAFTSLAQVALKATCPGVPDFYQGSELWDLSLVDPDNRRPVDYSRRRSLLAELSSRRLDIAAALDKFEDGRLKLWVTTCALHLRRRRPSVFKEGEYLPLMAEGARDDQVVSYARTLGSQAVITAVGRFFTKFEGSAPVGAAWSGCRLQLPEELPRGRYRDVLTDQEFELGPGVRTAEVSELFAQLPLAILEPAE